MKRSKKTLKTGHSTIFGRELLSSNDRVLDPTQHSQVEKISLQAFLYRRERGWGEGATFNSATAKQLQKPNNVTNKNVAFTSPSRGMSEAKVEQQSTETLSFRCWCERCRLTRGRIVKQKHAAFTLAEVLITLGIIGVVAALTLPALLTNIQSKVRAERSSSVQYKFSLATEKVMARLNLIGPYDSTDAFVDELQKYLKISKRCNANKLGSGCAFEVDGKCYTAVFSPKPLTKAKCKAEKGNLGIKTCRYNTDYWAGAVKQCGGVSKMPTADDLAKLASHLYKGNPSIGTEEYKSGLQWDQDAATALGFTSSGFYLLSGEEYSSVGACQRFFGSTYSFWNCSNRYYNYNQAVCIAD